MQDFHKKANKKGSNRLILGSGSPRRSELLNEITSDFSVLISAVDELHSHPNGPLFIVQENARLKATSIAEQHVDNWVLGADTLVVLGDQVLGKPHHMDQAHEMLRMLSGKTHEVSTGLCLVNRSENYEETKVETSRVAFKELNEFDINKYFENVNPLDKAGAYAIQTCPDLIIESFEGSHSNIIGLPLELLRHWLNELKI